MIYYPPFTYEGGQLANLKVIRYSVVAGIQTLSYPQSHTALKSPLDNSHSMLKTGVRT